MDFLALVKQFGLPLALLIAAVIVLWRALGHREKALNKALSGEIARLRGFQDAYFELLNDIAMKHLISYARRSERTLKANSK